MSVWPVDCFRDAVVLVSGGTSGIGAGVAEAFLQAGARVTATGATEAEAEALRARLPGIEAVACDVRDPEAVGALVGGLDRLDHVVNCAGVIIRDAEHEPETFAKVIDVNLNGTMRLCATARPLLAARRGTIVNMASMLSFFGSARAPGYAASKGGVAQLTKSLAITYAADGIRVNAVAPGWIETPLTEPLRTDGNKAGETILARTPLGRWGRPDEVAGAALWLASPMASFVTGAVIAVDGGYLTT